MEFQVGGDPCVVVGVDEVAVKLDESLQSYQVGEQPGTSGLIGHLALQRRVLDVGGLPAGGLRHGGMRRLRTPPARRYDRLDARPRRL